MLFPNLNTTFVQQLSKEGPWYISQLQDPTRTELKTTLQSDVSKHHHDVVMEKVLATYPDRVESAYNTNQRVQSFKRFLQGYMENSQGQICVVGHSQHFTYMTATKWNSFTEPPVEYRFLANCEFYPFDRHLTPVDI